MPDPSIPKENEKQPVKKEIKEELVPFFFIH